VVYRLLASWLQRGDYLTGVPRRIRCWQLTKISQTPGSIFLTLSKCSESCNSLTDVEPYYVHSFIELPAIKLGVTHCILHRDRSHHCGKMLKPFIPPQHRTNSSPRLFSIIAVRIDSRSATQNFLFSMLRLPIRQETNQKILNRVSRATAPPLPSHRRDCPEISRQPRGRNRTACYDKGMLHGIRNIWAACFMIHRHRSKKVFQTLIQDWQGILVSDGSSVYAKWWGCVKPAWPI